MLQDWQTTDNDTLSNNKSIIIFPEFEYFKAKKKEIIEYLAENMILHDSDSMDDRILSSATASTSTHTNSGEVCTLILWRRPINWKLKHNDIFLGRRRISQAIEEKNKSKKNSFSESIFGRESTNVTFDTEYKFRCVNTFYKTYDLLYAQPTLITVHTVMI